MKATKQLHDLGQSLWLDNITRELLDCGQLQRYIEEFSVTGVDNGNSDEVTVRADDKEFRARVRLDTPREREYFQHGGILQYVLRRLLAEN